MRLFLRPLSALVLAAVLLVGAWPAQAADKVLRIGYQKYGTLIFLKARGGLEERVKPLGYSVTWSEFPAGPQLLEAMNAGAIDIGSTGEAPPIFAQAAGTSLVYIGNEPASPLGEAILVAKDSPIRTVADLKGKTVALNKGSNVHYLLVRALEAAGVAYTDIKPVFLAPADGRAAFESGKVDAWAIWDPFYAAGQAATGARTLVTGENLVPNVQFYLSTRSFAAENGAAVSALIAALGDVDHWVSANKSEVASSLSSQIRIPAPYITTALDRQAFGIQAFGIQAIDAATIAAQQKVADVFAALNILPKPVSIADAVIKPGL